MLAHGALPVHDPFSYTFAGARWVPHEWLAEIVHGGGLSRRRVERAGPADDRLLCREPRAADPLSAALGRAVFGPDRGGARRRPGRGPSAGPAAYAGDAAPGAVVGGACSRRATRARRRPSGCCRRWRCGPICTTAIMFGLLLAFYLAAEAVLAGPWRLEARRWGLFAALALAATLATPNGIAGSGPAVPADGDAGAAILVHRVAQPEFPGFSAARNHAARAGGARPDDRGQGAAEPGADAGRAVPHGARSHPPCRSLGPRRAARSRGVIGAAACRQDPFGTRLRGSAAPPPGSPSRPPRRRWR